MREIPMPSDNRITAEQSTLEAARNDDGLRVIIAAAVWDSAEPPTAAAKIGGYVYEIADRVARAVEERERELHATVARAYAFAEEMHSYCSPHGVAADYAKRLEARLKGDADAPAQT